MADTSRPLFIPVLLGTVRRGRMSQPAAQLVHAELARRAGVETELIDIATLPLRIDDAGEAIKMPAYAAAMERADGLVIVSPEYNHGYSGLLKHVLDSCLKEYIHKAVGIVGVSAGSFGGTRTIENLLPVMRELGLATIFYDVNIGKVGRVFSPDGTLLDEAVVRRSDRFIRELMWMSKTLRHGREHITIDDEAAERPVRTICPMCGDAMTHHADKIIPAAAANDAEVVVAAAHTCGGCGFQMATLSSAPADDVQ